MIGPNCRVTVSLLCYSHLLNCGGTAPNGDMLVATNETVIDQLRMCTGVFMLLWQIVGNPCGMPHLSICIQQECDNYLCHPPFQSLVLPCSMFNALLWVQCCQFLFFLHFFLSNIYLLKFYLQKLKNSLTNKRHFNFRTVNFELQLSPCRADLVSLVHELCILLFIMYLKTTKNVISDMTSILSLLLSREHVSSPRQSTFPPLPHPPMGLGSGNLFDFNRFLSSPLCLSRFNSHMYDC